MNYILDVDTGVDDALALAYACGLPNFQILGVTCVFGNVNMPQAVMNTKHVLHMLGREHGVYGGASYALNDSSYVQKRGGKVFHGENGFANLSVPKHHGESCTASEFIIEQAKIHGNDLCIIATGAMTNLANAIQMDATAMKDVHIVIMGGAFACAGNVSRTAEANIAQDPVAANTLFQSGLDITMIGLDVTMRVLLTRADIARWQKGNETAKMMYDLCDYYIGAHVLINAQAKGCALHDPLAVAVAVHPAFVKTIPCCLTVVEDGEEAGCVLLDVQAMNTQKRTVNIAWDVDERGVKQHFLETMHAVLHIGEEDENCK